MEIESFHVLPNDVVVEILASVAANSMDDFFNAKISVKLVTHFLDNSSALNLPGVHAVSVLFSSLTGQPLTTADATVLTLYRTACISGLTSELLSQTDSKYEYISFAKVELGMELLKRAAQIGHLGASYVVGLLLIGKGNEFKKEGVRLLRKVYMSRQVVECRKKYRRRA
ncbi:hypothetical protein NL676_002752 [Syzygium grande]|nr:hypothetical protein NL676_002752 [Syzygium grande]